MLCVSWWIRRHAHGLLLWWWWWRWQVAGRDLTGRRGDVFSSVVGRLWWRRQAPSSGTGDEVRVHVTLGVPPQLLRFLSLALFRSSPSLCRGRLVASGHLAIVRCVSSALSLATFRLLLRETFLLCEPSEGDIVVPVIV